MELVIALAALAALRLLAGLITPENGTARDALAPRDMPIRVHRLIRREAPGLFIRTVTVEMDGSSGVRYTVTGSLPDNSAVTLVAHGDERVTGPFPGGRSAPLPGGVDEQSAATLPGGVDGQDAGQYPGAAGDALPPLVRQSLVRCLPSFHPSPEGARLVRGRDSAWYELDGMLADGVPVDVKISPDGHDLLMTRSSPRPRP